jgi:cobalamin-dependent methionine synthase I
MNRYGMPTPTAPVPKQLGVQLFEDYDLAQLVDYID